MLALEYLSYLSFPTECIKISVFSFNLSFRFLKFKLGLPDKYICLKFGNFEKFGTSFKSIDSKSNRFIDFGSLFIIFCSNLIPTL